MINRRTDTTTAVALLERADPVDEQRLVAELDRTSAWERTARLIAAEAAVPPPRRSARAAGARQIATGARVKLTAATVAAAAAVALAVVVIDGGTPAVQSASAKTISGALRAVTAPTGSILHIDATTTQITAGHPTYIWEQPVYEQVSPPYRTRTVEKRLPGTPAGTEGVIGMGIVEQVYDPTNNTIYVPAVPKPTPQPGAQTLTPAQEQRLYEPYMAQYIRSLRAKLASGAARVDGRATVHGRAAIKIRFAHSDEVDYVAADGSYVPIETIQGNPSTADGQLINVFHTFEYLPMADNAGLLSLTAQHPTARVNRSLAAFRAADKRLFPNG
jgi:hypothetical protein